ncbi:hypothetical protein AMATHDRAFT_5012 [Amanita thiersii Skay4041]|uniref:Uncharacterized protein n=1 Tax=Amanita thiersii Skay4041 TaxID=703135 RepID=A0A2A9NGW0_9AGAR|nr:hypothetical protein AMATHDRAFT_5012 [Amanita thiersii Skay4041]
MRSGKSKSTSLEAKRSTSSSRESDRLQRTPRREMKISEKMFEKHFPCRDKITEAVRIYLRAGPDQMSLNQAIMRRDATIANMINGMIEIKGGLAVVESQTSNP